MAYGGHFLRYGQVAQTSAMMAMASSRLARLALSSMGTTGSGTMSAVRSFRTRQFLGFSRIAQSIPTTGITQPPVTQAGEGSTAALVNATSLFDRLNGHGLWSGCAPLALSRKTGLIWSDSSNHFTRSASSYSRHTRTRQASSPRSGWRCAPSLHGSAGGAERAVPLPHLVLPDAPNWPRVFCRAGARGRLLRSF